MNSSLNFKIKITDGLNDIHSALKNWRLIFLLAWQDVKQRYRRSIIGPFWLTISMAIMIGTIGLVFGRIFNAETSEFLPFLTIGIASWTLISSVVNEGAVSFCAAESIIKQLPLPLSIHVLRVVVRNVIIFMHNILILPILYLFYGRDAQIESLWAFVGLLLVILNISWMTLVVAIVCTRFRDIPQIISSALQVLFYLTPIMWMPNLIKSELALFYLKFNPFYHLINIIRTPLLGELPVIFSWFFCVSLAVLGWGLSISIFSFYKKRIPYWV